MVRQLFILTLSLLLFIEGSLADVVPPGHINRQFMFTNLDKFPGYTFYYIEHNYRYDHGYKAIPPDTLAAENNQWYFASHRGNDKTYLLARDSKGKMYRSDVQVGGAAVVSPGTGLLVDVYNISGIRKGLIILRKTKEITQDESGKQRERKVKAEFLSSISNNDLTMGLSIISFTAFGLIVGLLVFRRRKTRYIALAT